MALAIFLAYDSLHQEYFTKKTKLERYGIREKANTWFGYLSKITQRVEITKIGTSATSTTYINKSVIGPTLFIIYLNGLSNMIQNRQKIIVNFVEDTSLLISGSDKRNFRTGNRPFLIEHKIGLNKIN